MDLDRVLERTQLNNMTICLWVIPLFTKQLTTPLLSYETNVWFFNKYVQFSLSSFFNFSGLFFLCLVCFSILAFVVLMFTVLPVISWYLIDINLHLVFLIRWSLILTMEWYATGRTSKFSVFFSFLYRLATH